MYAVLGVDRLSSIDLELTGALFSLSRRIDPDLCAKTGCAVGAAVAVVVTPAADVVGTVGVGVDALVPAAAEFIDVLICAVAAEVDVDGLAVEDIAEADDDTLSAALVLDDDGRDFDSR